MNFQTLTRVERAQTYLDIAFKAGQSAASRVRGSKKHNTGRTRLEKGRNIETARIDGLKNSLSGNLSRILVSFPNISSLPSFYYELVKAAIEYYRLKKSLAAINWGRNKVEDFYRQYIGKIRSTQNFDDINRLRKELFGRMSSIIYQLDKALIFLEQSRKTMKEFPTIKTETKTVVIVGFPNVGKTTLLYKLTGSKPEIAGYAFTTKGINVSYFSCEKERIQVVDTPGTLNRFNKMNMIEKQAYLAMKYCADLFVYVFDLTEPYPLKEQEKLYERINDFKKKRLVYVSKADTMEKHDMEKLEKFAEKHEAIYDTEKLKEKIIEILLFP